MLRCSSEGHRSYHRGQDLKTWKPWSHTEGTSGGGSAWHSIWGTAPDGQLCLSPPTSRVQVTLPSQRPFKRSPLLHHTAISRGILLTLDIELQSKGLSFSSYCIWCLAFLNSVIWTAQNHPLTPGMVGTLYSWFRLFTSVRNTMLLFLRIPRHTFQQYPSHTSWHPRKAKEIRASLPLGFCSDRSCRILKLKGYRHPAPMVPAK